MFEVQIESRAEKMLRSLDATVRMKVAEDIYALGTRFMDGKRLTGILKGCRSQRSGDYRILYDVHFQKSIVRVLCIGHRSEVYRKR